MDIPLTNSFVQEGSEQNRKETLHMTSKKHTIMAVVVLILLQAPWGQAQSESVLFKLESLAAVHNGPSQKTIFTLDQPVSITKIWTYHWNNGKGVTPGRIGLRNVATGQTVGMWDVTATYHMFNSSPGAAWPSRGDGPPFLYWTVQPSVHVPPGTYEVLDSDPATWSANAEMRNMGCAWVYGMARAGSTEWRSVGRGDCPGRDVKSSTGPEPDPAFCTPEFVGFTAVCWEGNCTYKNVKTEACTGGARPGRMYRCESRSGSR
jgi:hypothetical protein